MSHFSEAFKELDKAHFPISIHTNIGTYTITIKYKQKIPKIGAIIGSAYCGGLDLNTVVNLRDSGKLRQFTTVFS